MVRSARGGRLPSALLLAQLLSGFPQTALRHDRLSAIEQWGMSEHQATANEIAHGRVSIASGETAAGAKSFGGGAGRHGQPLG